MRSGTAAAAALLLAGCAALSTPTVDMPAPAPALPPPAPAAAPAHGAIFHAASYRPLFEDRRARHVGDTLTIQIEEVVNASQQSTTTLDRTNALKAGVTALPYASQRLLGQLRADASSGVNGKSDGKTGSVNTFSGIITVSVRQVLPNGHLLVQGEKHIGVNGNVDVMRFSGLVDPSAIRSGNVVSSTQVAEARLAQSGRGDVGRLQPLGWLARFFLSVAPV